jgi:nucleotide-binding universal stress UspA family protein
MYRKVLLAYDGSIEGRRALREGAKLAQLCCAEVFLLAVVELSSITAPEVGLTIPIDEQTANYKAILRVVRIAWLLSLLCQLAHGGTDRFANHEVTRECLQGVFREE